MHAFNFLNFLISYCKCGFNLTPSWSHDGSSWTQGCSCFLRVQEHLDHDQWLRPLIIIFVTLLFVSFVLIPYRIMNHFKLYYT